MKKTRGFLQLGFFASLCFLVNVVMAAPTTFPPASVVNLGYIQIASDTDSLTIPATTTVNVYNSGWTNISGGRLEVDGTLAGMSLNIMGGRLLGTGIVATWGQVANSGGIVMPGHSGQVGQLTVIGDYIQGPNGTLQININSSGASQLQVGGNAALDGALKPVLVGGFAPAPGATYTVLNASSVTGQFAAQSFFATPTLFFVPAYSGTNVTITAGHDFLNPGLVADLTLNQKAVATTLNSISQNINNLRTDFATLLSGVDILPDNQSVAGALQTLQPLGHDIFLNMAVNNMTLTSSLLQQRLAGLHGICNLQATARNYTAPSGLNVMLSGNAYGGHAEEGLHSKNYNLNGQAGALSVDYPINPEVNVGFMGQWNQANADLNFGSSVDEHGFVIGPYAMYHNNNLYASALAGYGRNDYQLERVINFDGVNRVAKASPAANEFLAYAGAGYDFSYNKQWQYGPNASLQWVNMDIDRYTEHGANALDLNVAGKNVTSLRSSIGVHTAYRTFWNDFCFSPMLSANYVHEFINGPGAMTFSFVHAPNTLTTLSLPDPNRNFFLFDAGVGISGSKKWDINLGYLAQVGSHNVINAVVAKGVWRFG